MRKLIFSLAATLLLAPLAMAADDAAPPVATGAIPSGYVWYSGGSVAVGIGYTWGHGTLYNSKDQKQYPFKLTGVSVADVAGKYSAVTAGVTIIEGGSVAYLKNEKGVVIKLHSQTGGLRFNLSANGMRITLQ
jgi:hypothetical protein